MDTADIRRHTLNTLASWGLPGPTHLPLLDPPSLRPTQTVLDRLFALNVVTSVAFGFSRTAALAWLDQEELTKALSPRESAFLSTGRGPVEDFQAQPETMWALAWAVRWVDALDFWRPCDGDFVHRLPDLKVQEPRRSFEAHALIRPVEHVAEALDLAYCLHWVTVDAALGRRSLPLQNRPAGLLGRRHALEWMLGQDDWDEISLDT